jgi:hypothetical protein
MNVNSTQNDVFNRTGRLEIPNSHVRRHVDGQIAFNGLHEGEWSSKIAPSDLDASVLYVDIRSLLFLQRREILNPAQVFDKNWTGCVFKVPGELMNGDYRVKLEVTIAFPAGHSKAGQIIARSNEIVVIEGPEDSEGEGSSLLPVRPAADHIPDLSRLEVIEPEGPVLYVNSKIPELSWKELASDPRFKFGIFSSCVREILRYLAFNPGSRDTWGAPWLELDGIKGRDFPNLDDVEDFHEASELVTEFVTTACDAFLEQLELPKLFVEALAKREGE